MRIDLNADVGECFGPYSIGHDTGLFQLADSIAYVNDDIDDAVRASVLQESALPEGATTVLGSSYPQRINTMVTDVVMQTLEAERKEVRMSDEILSATLALRAFLFDAVYEDPQALLMLSRLPLLKPARRSALAILAIRRGLGGRLRRAADFERRDARKVEAGAEEADGSSLAPAVRASGVGARRGA